MEPQTETTLRYGLPGDFTYIDYLRKKEGNALGFVPKGTYLSILEKRTVNDRRRWEYSDILITVDNDEYTGFCYFSYFPDWVNIVQIAVQEDARRWYRARLMVDEVERVAIAMGKLGIKCRVAHDLESNLFWRAMGFDPVDIVTSTSWNRGESASKRKLILYNKAFGGLFSSGLFLRNDRIELPIMEIENGNV